MIDIKKKFGRRLFQLRTEAGMTQAKVATITNLSVDLISRIERGARAPSLETIEKIAEALSIRPADLFNFDGEELKIQSECPFEVMELWKLLKDGRPHHIKKICQIAKIILD
ncbi:MAG: helix-turn-helix transcriptional regulator [Pseudomonadota bacterium]